MKPLKLATADTLAHIEKPPMLIDEIIPEGSITMVAGPTYSGKTFFAMDAARAVAFHSSPFMGRFTVPQHGNVLFIEQDSPEYDTGRAFYSMIKPILTNLGPDTDGAHQMEALRFAWHPDLDLKNDSDAARIYITAESLRTSLGYSGPVERAYRGCRLIVLDTFRALHTTDEDSSTEGEALMQRIKRIRHETGAAILLVHHMPHHAKRSRGTSAYEAACDNVFHLKADKKRGCTYVSVAKARAIQPPNWSYRIITEEHPDHGTIKRVLADEPRVEKPTLPPAPTPHRVGPNDILSMLPATVPELVEQTGKSQATVYRWLGLLPKDSISRDGEIYRLTPEATP